MAHIDENTVSVTHQLKVKQRVDLINPEGKGLRVMFAGNSITYHTPAPEIGWHYDWGMSASAPEKDYVHVCMAEIEKTDPDAAYCICKAGQWEQNWKKGESVFDEYRAARDFCADVIVARFVENCAKDGDPAAFLEQYGKFVDFIDGTGKAKVIITTSFWSHPMDDAIRAYARKKGYPLVELGDLGAKPEMKAYGLFEHKGVASHPGDLGMEHIAKRIMEAF